MSNRPPSIAAGVPSQSGLGQAGWRAALAVGALFITTAPVCSAGLFELLFHHDVQVITSTDVTAAGAMRRPPSPSDPTYYVPLIKGYHDFGVSFGGEKVPSQEQAILPIVRILAKDGYLLADARHKPTQVIMFTWGTMNPNIVSDPGDPDMPGEQVNRTQVLQFLGGDKLGLLNYYPNDADVTLLPGLTRFDPDADAIAHIAHEPLYIVALASYEFPVAQPKNPKLLWRTKISCPSIGLMLGDTLLPMLEIAAPNIGRETNRPVWVNASDKFRTDVQIGKLKTEEYLDSAPPAGNGKPAPAATGRDAK
jgi:hypothetical protein